MLHGIQKPPLTSIYTNLLFRMMVWLALWEKWVARVVSKQLLFSGSSRRSDACGLILQGICGFIQTTFIS
jgi:hypothetical protein